MNKNVLGYGIFSISLSIINDIISTLGLSSHFFLNSSLIIRWHLIISIFLTLSATFCIMYLLYNKKMFIPFITRGIVGILRTLFFIIAYQIISTKDISMGELAQFLLKMLPILQIIFAITIIISSLKKEVYFIIYGIILAILNLTLLFNVFTSQVEYADIIISFIIPLTEIIMLFIFINNYSIIRKESKNIIDSP